MRKLQLYYLISTVFSVALSAPLIQASINDGFYAGVAAGWEHMSGSRSDGARHRASGALIGSISDKFRANNFSYEFVGGYQVIFGNSNVLLGFEPFVSYKLNKDTTRPNIAGILKIDSQIKRTWDFGGVARLGYILAEDWLFYLLVGPEISRFNLRYKETDVPGNPLEYKQNKWLWGLRYGAGIEHSLEWGNIGLQISQTRFQKHSFSYNAGTTDRLVDIKPRILNVSLRLTIPFE